jgi:hypothetical protein
VVDWIGRGQSDLSPDEPPKRPDELFEGVNELETEPLDYDLEEDFTMDEYSQLLLAHGAFERVLSTLRSSIALDSGGSGLSGIKTKIYDLIPEAKMIRHRRDVPMVCLSLSVDWNLNGFYIQGGYKDPLADVVRRTITLTGSFEDAQAMTAEAYMVQTWPVTGLHTLDLVCSILGEKSHYHEGMSTTDLATLMLISLDLREDGTVIRAEFRLATNELIVKTFGTATAIIELVQQLSWLAAALRPSPFAAGIARVVPRVKCARDAEKVPNPYSGRWNTEFDSLIPIECKVDYAFMEVSSASPSHQDGRCWLDMFQNPVMVADYPILARTAPNLGLEISPVHMAQLIQAKYVNKMDCGLIMKGFSALFAAMRVVGDLIVWHHVFDPRGDQISYTDVPSSAMKGLDYIAFDNSRHVVGWSPCTQCFIGKRLSRSSPYEADHFVCRIRHCQCLQYQAE